MPGKIILQLDYCAGGAGGNTQPTGSRQTVTPSGRSPELSVCWNETHNLSLAPNRTTGKLAVKLGAFAVDNPQVVHRRESFDRDNFGCPHATPSELPPLSSVTTAGLNVFPRIVLNSKGHIYLRRCFF